MSITTQLKYDHRTWSTAFQITPHILEYCLHLSQALYIFLSNHVSSGVFCNVNCNTGVLSCRLEYCSLGTDVHTSVLFAECCILAPGAMHPHSSIHAKLENLQRILEHRCALPTTLPNKIVLWAAPPAYQDTPALYNTKYYSIGHRTQDRRLLSHCSDILLHSPYLSIISLHQSVSADTRVTFLHTPRSPSS